MFDFSNTARDSMARSFRGRRGRVCVAMVMWSRLALVLGTAGAALLGLLAAAVAVATAGASSTRTLVTRQPVIALAADGDRVALVSGKGGVCASVVVWSPTRRRVARARSARRSECAEANPVTRGVALAGTRVAWLTAGGRSTLESTIGTTRLARLAPVQVALAVSMSGMGDFARTPVGDGTLLAFTVDRRCAEGEDGDPQCPPGRKTGDVISASVWRVGGRGDCPNSYARVRGCTRVAREDGELTVLAVEAGRIAVRTDRGTALLDAAGHVLEEFDVTARQAAISGKRLALRTTRAVEVYDIGSGQLVQSFPAENHLRIEDLDHDILVTAVGRKATLRRLGDGRTVTIHAAGIVHAQLESAGLFVASAHSVRFKPMQEVTRMLGGARASREA